MRGAISSHGTDQGLRLLGDFCAPLRRISWCSCGVDFTAHTMGEKNFRACSASASCPQLPFWIGDQVDVLNTCLCMKNLLREILRLLHSPGIDLRLT